MSEGPERRERSERAARGAETPARRGDRAPAGPGTSLTEGRRSLGWCYEVGSAPVADGRDACLGELLVQVAGGTTGHADGGDRGVVVRDRSTAGQEQRARDVLQGRRRVQALTSSEVGAFQETAVYAFLIAES